MTQTMYMANINTFNYTTYNLTVRAAYIIQ